MQEIPLEQLLKEHMIKLLLLKIILNVDILYQTIYNYLNINKIINDETIKKVNEILKKFILEEFFISTAPERKEASKLYLDFYSNAEEKSINSSDGSNNNIQDKDMKEEIIFNNVKEEKEYDNMVQNYLKENPGVNIEKIEEESDDEKENDKIPSIAFS